MRICWMIREEGEEIWFILMWYFKVEFISGVFDYCKFIFRFIIFLFVLYKCFFE